MELFNDLLLGFSVALTPANLAYGFLGVLLGTIIGVLPGLGPVATISILLPVTFALPAPAALIMLAGIYYGAQYGGSTTAILVNPAGRELIRRHRHRRLPDGAQGQGRAGARHRGAVLLHRRHHRHRHHRGGRSRAGRRSRSISARPTISR